MNNVKHVIFTNFGIGIFDEIWLMYRFEIFKNTVFPSLFFQSNQNFEWYIFIDKNLTGLFKLKLEELSDKYINLKLIEVEDYSYVSAEIETIISHIDAECLITSRIDDDDCLHTEAIQYIQESAINYSGKDKIVVISFKNGLEFLPSDNCVRNISYETLALGLSLVNYSDTGKRKSVTSYAHHTILETLSKQNIQADFIAIEKSYPTYLYTKHPLSDSYFFGARARILGDSTTIMYKMDPINFDLFGITEENVACIETILFDAPIGMPHKYLEQLGSLRNQIKKEKTLVDTNQMSDKLQKLEAKKHKFETSATRPNPGRLAKKRKLRVAIVGSCVSRDLFEFEQEVLSGFEIVFYSARSSMISYLSLPNTDSRLRISGIAFEEKRALYDLDKTHWEQLEYSLPDIILTDFVDERIGLIQHQGSIFSASGPIIKAFERAEIDFEILRPWSEKVQKIRLWAVKPFLERLRTICPNIIVHKAGWAETFYDETKKILNFDGSEFDKLISLNNEILNQIFESAETSGVPVEFIGGKEIGMHAGGNHKWAFCPYHYNDKYYKSLARQFLARIM